ncbi:MULTISPECIES: VOC family protein [Burkholderia]|uniref:VOC family protein n=1 Tax=Burkholderia TaxID=32008 RepID=UPI00064EE89E|nr:MULTISPECIES: VOC family protein [Burkholderia]KML19681.1 hypothetical protein VL00_05525 [Burkholderia cepacia]KMN59522.1 hypothetical protein VK92_15155 [Burkholderia sp. LK4]
MFDHISFCVSDYAQTVGFYDRALQPLGIKRLFEIDSAPTRRAGYGDVLPALWIVEGDSAIGKLHLAFAAASREEVDAFHREALAAGGVDNGGPGYRQYHAGYYGAFVLDPNGHNIEAVFHELSKT